MSKTGINFQRCNVVSAQLHNARDAAYLESVRASGKATYELFDDRRALNTTWHNPDYEGKTLEQILEDCRERYRQHVGQAPQEEDRVRKVKDKKTGMYKEVTTAGWSPIREGVIPIKEDTSIVDFAPVTAWLEERGVHVVSITLHRDEGHKDPVTGERKYNNHAHMIADWTDHETGKTAKLNAKDMSELNQDVIPTALGMEAGTSKTVTGAEHLTAQQQREKAAAKNTRRLLAENSALKTENSALKTENQELRDENQGLREEKQQLTTERDKYQDLADSALERARAAEKAASREQLRSNAADVGARILGLFGRGAVAEANTDRDDALRRAELAEEAAAEANSRAETAQEAQNQAEIARDAAIRARNTAVQQKSAYGRERYDAGHAAGYAAGRESAKGDTKDLEDALTQKQNRIDELETAAEQAAAELTELQEWVPTAARWKQYRDEMRQAGLTDEQVKTVFRNGIAKLNVTHRPKALTSAYTYETQVWIGFLKTAANRSQHGVWFRATSIDERWRNAVNYVKAVVEHIWNNLGKKPQQTETKTTKRSM